MAMWCRSCAWTIRLSRPSPTTRRTRSLRCHAQQLFGRLAELLDRQLLPQRVAFAGAGLDKHQRHRRARMKETRPLAALMLGEALLRVVADTAVQGAVGRAYQVHEPRLRDEGINRWDSGDGSFGHGKSASYRHLSGDSNRASSARLKCLQALLRLGTNGVLHERRPAEQRAFCTQGLA